MISLIQNDDGLIGSEEAIASLAKAKEARILVISDSHGKSFVFNSIIEKFGPTCDALVLCGDTGIDLLSSLERASSDRNFRKAFPPVLAVAGGNGDPSDVSAEFLPSRNLKLPGRKIFTVAGKKIYLTHGHLHGVDWGDELLLSEAEQEKCQIIYYGHTHVRREERINDIYIVNPGSCSRPRDGLNPCFGITTIKPGYLDTYFMDV